MEIPFSSDSAAKDFIVGLHGQRVSSERPLKILRWSELKQCTAEDLVIEILVNLNWRDADLPIC